MRLCLGQRKQSLHVTVVFGVMNDEFDGEEYSETKQHDQYRVLSTVVKIVKNTILKSKPHLKLVEFSGVSRAMAEKRKNKQYQNQILVVI